MQSGAQTSDDVQVSRYTKASLIPSLEIVQPLEAVIQLEIPQSMTVLGDGLKYLLSKSGYRLKPPNLAETPEMFVLFSLPIPEQHRSMGAIRLRTALGVLAGEAYELQVNRVSREIWFTLKEESLADFNFVDFETYRAQWKRKQMRQPSANERAQMHPTARVFQYEAMSKSTLPEIDGPIRSGETLGEIALRYVGSSVTKSQVMTAIFMANKGAFLKENINLLISGATLRIPSIEEISDYGKPLAEQLQAEHRKKFRAGTIL